MENNRLPVASQVWPITDVIKKEVFEGTMNAEY